MGSKQSREEKKIDDQYESEQQQPNRELAQRIDELNRRENALDMRERAISQNLSGRKHGLFMKLLTAPGATVPGLEVAQIFNAIDNPNNPAAVAQLMQSQPQQMQFNQPPPPSYYAATLPPGMAVNQPRY